MKVKSLLENVNLKDLLLQVQQKLIDDHSIEAELTNEGQHLHLSYDFEPTDDGSFVTITVSVSPGESSAFIESLSDDLGDFDDQVDLTADAIIQGLDKIEKQNRDAAKNIWHHDDEE